MNACERYFENAVNLLRGIAEKQSEAIEKSAVLCAEALSGRGYIFTFGTGHSHIMAEEIFYRAGGAARVYPILEDALMLHKAAARSSELERVTGLARVLLDDIDCISEGGVMFIFSNSGRNTGAVDMAVEAKKRGLSTVCITNMNHTLSVTSRHPSGKKLYQVCDIVIDNMGCIGDAALDINGYTVGPTSTVTGSAIMQAIVCRAVEIVTERGEIPEVFASANTDGGDEANAGLIKKYKPVIKSL